MTHYKDTVQFSKYLGAVDVSTLDTLDSGWETCLFFADGSSLVVANYTDAVHAAAGHHAFLQRDVLRHITVAHKELRERPWA